MMLKTASFNLTECKHRFHCDLAECTNIQPFSNPSQTVGKTLDMLSRSSLAIPLSKIKIIQCRIFLKLQNKGFKLIKYFVYSTIILIN